MGDILEIKPTSLRGPLSVPALSDGSGSSSDISGNRVTEEWQKFSKFSSVEALKDATINKIKGIYINK